MPSPLEVQARHLSAAALQMAQAAEAAKKTRNKELQELAEASAIDFSKAVRILAAAALRDVRDLQPDTCPYIGQGK